MNDTIAVILNIHHIVLSALGIACFTTLLNRSITDLSETGCKITQKTYSSDSPTFFVPIK